MPKEISSSHEGKDQRPASPTNDGARSQGKVRDFATRPETHQYAASLKREVLRLRGGADDYDDYGDAYDPGGYGGYGGYGDSYDLGGYGRRSPERDWSSQPEERMEFSDQPRSLSPARDSHLRGMERNPREWSEEPSSTDLMSNEEIHQLREYLSKIGDESGKSDVNLLPARYREPWGVGSDLQQWSERLMSTNSISNAELEQLRECLINVGDESGRESGSQGEQHSGQGDGNGGGDGGNRGVRDGYQSDSDKDARELHKAREEFF